MKTIKEKVKSKKYVDVVYNPEPALLTGNEKIDEWWSAEGGIVWGSSIFVTGTSGAGKTTFMINLMKWLKGVKTSMYSREMGGGSVKKQTNNISLTHENAYIVDAEDCPDFDSYMEEVEALKPKVIIIDSLQVIAKEDYEMHGILSEDKACYHVIKKLRKWAKENNGIYLMIGHNTKSGMFAGKNTIVQMHDGHIDFVYDKSDNARTMSWGQKNRKGPMGTLHYEFGENGMLFYTEDEWDLKVNNKTFSKKLNEFLKGYIGGMKSHSGYPGFRKALVKHEKILLEVHKDSPEEYYINMIKVIFNLINAHGLNTFDK